MRNDGTLIAFREGKAAIIITRLLRDRAEPALCGIVRDSRDDLLLAALIGWRGRLHGWTAWLTQRLSCPPNWNPSLFGLLFGPLFIPGRKQEPERVRRRIQRHALWIKAASLYGWAAIRRWRDFSGEAEAFNCCPATLSAAISASSVLPAADRPASGDSTRSGFSP